MAEATRDDHTMDELPTPPPRTVRRFTIGLMALTFIAALGLTVSLWPEAHYALSPSKPVDAGNLATAALNTEHIERYVQARVELDTTRAISYRRVADAGTYFLAPVKHVNGPARWVQYRVPDALQGPRFLPPKLAAGRLARVGALSWRYRGLIEALARSGDPNPETTWILLDGADPARSQWLIGLVGLLGVFALWSLIGLIRLVRPIAPPARSQT
jgi:hypothetical protein